MPDINILDYFENEQLSEDDIIHLIDQLVNMGMKSDTSTCKKVNIFLRSKLCLHGVSRAEVASFLNISTRTLSRKLKNEKTGFHKLLDKERQRRCYQYLKHDNYCVQQLTELLGLSDISHFYRSFKQWTGSSFAETKSKMAEKHSNIDTFFHRQKEAGQR